ncbi:MAG: hypothetical protein ACLFQV_10780 [Vulcanimicrobiota bacterium]
MGYDTGVVELKTLQSLRIIWKEQLHKSSIFKINCSEGGKYLLILGNDQKMQVIDILTGRIIVSKPFGFLPRDGGFIENRRLILAIPG